MPFGSDTIRAFDDSESTPIPQRCEDLRPIFSDDIDYLMDLTLEKPGNGLQAQFFLEDLTFFVSELVGRNAPREVQRMLYEVVAAKIDPGHEDSRDFLAIIHGIIFGHITPPQEWDRGGISSEIAVFLTQYSFHPGTLFLIEELTNEAIYEPDYVLPRPASAESIHAVNQGYLATPMSFSVHEGDESSGSTAPLHEAKSVVGETKLALIAALERIPEVEAKYIDEPYVEPAPSVPANLAPMFVDFEGHLPELTDMEALRVWEQIQDTVGGIITMSLQTKRAAELAASGAVGRVATEAVDDKQVRSIEPEIIRRRSFLKRILGPLWPGGKGL